MNRISGIRAADPLFMNADASQNRTQADQSKPPVANDSTGAALKPIAEENKSTVVNHVLGGVQALWGAGQAVGGTAFAIGSAETVVGTAAGVAIAAHGVDDFQAGIRQMWTGKPVENATQTLATEAAKKAGAGPLTAAVIGAAVDVAAGGPSGGVKKASEKVAKKTENFATEMAKSVFQDAKNQERQLNELERGTTLPEGTHKISGVPNPRTSRSNKLSEILGKELEGVGKPRPGPNHDAHHIAPIGDPRVEKLRDFLQELGVERQDLLGPANGAWLPRNSKAFNVQGAAHHEFTFSSEYIKDLEDTLGHTTTREDALKHLREFGEALEKGAWPPIGSWPWNQGKLR